MGSEVFGIEENIAYSKFDKKKTERMGVRSVLKSQFLREEWLCL
jgi:hypothetical protein